MKRKTFSLWGLSFLFILSCASKGDVPEWVYNFRAEGNKICGVGSAAPHIRGKAYQRATAIARALDEIARQKGVTVNVEVEKFTRGSSSGGVATTLQVYSLQTTKGEVVRAKIVDTYYDPSNRMFYVLMCEEK